MRWKRRRRRRRRKRGKRDECRGERREEPPST